MYKYKHFIPQNTAPNGAKSIGVYDKTGNKVLNIPLGRLTPTKKEKLYSFGVVSDIHLFNNPYVTWQPNPKFDNALSHFENNGCAMCIVCGDLTQTGFYSEKTENGATSHYIDEAQFAVYKEICEKHTIPVYEICGNHESYYGKPITENMDKLKTYTGKDVLTYTITQENDLFILVGQPRDTWVMSDEALQWLYETLEANRNKRCFVFVHSHMDGDSGNPLNVRDNSIFNYWGATKTKAFKNLMAHYKNTVLFHGHTHMKFQSQEFDTCANYTEKNGFRSVHIPSLSAPRTLLSNGTWTGAEDESYGYIVEVYEDCITLNGIDFINNKHVPLGVYKIDTALQSVAAKSFTDSTGTIKTQ